VVKAPVRLVKHLFAIELFLLQPQGSRLKN
jgi:hypothetical protein